MGLNKICNTDYNPLKHKTEIDPPQGLLIFFFFFFFFTFFLSFFFSGMKKDHHIMVNGYFKGKQLCNFQFASLLKVE